MSENYIDVASYESHTFFDAVAGEVVVRYNANLHAPDLKSCDLVQIRPGATMYAPLLAECKKVLVELGGTLYAPLLQPLAVSLHYLFYEKGKYHAGCRCDLPAKQALQHWDREDERAKLFTAAILKNENRF